MPFSEVPGRVKIFTREGKVLIVDYYNTPNEISLFIIG